MFEHEFYPTPRSVIDDMLRGLDFRCINTVLEPSSGKGDLVKAIKDKLKHSRYSSYNRDTKSDIDCIEIDYNLRYILQGENYRVVHDDFLTYNSLKRYDAIIMNPPFSQGDKHLLKALDMQEQYGGHIVCLLNAETLKNPYSNTRKDLLRRLEEHNADIKYIENAFISAEVKTNVEIAIVKVNIPRKENNSILINELRHEEQFREEVNNSNNIIEADFLKGIVQQYNFEVKAGLRLIAEYNAMKPFILGSFKDDHNSNPILSLVITDHNRNDSPDTLENAYIKKVRMKYWQALFTSEQFMGLFTSNLRQKYYDKINELKDYDFSLYNIYTIKIQLNNEMTKGVEDTILNLFEEFSHKHHWQDEKSKNIHYYNGWATNKAYKINKKIIIPLAAFRDMEYSWGRYEPTNYKIVEKLTDIEKVFNYLDNGQTEDVDIKEELKFAEGYGETKQIPLKYFMVTFFKKGTCHIEFTNLDLLMKFNLFGSQRKNWIPPSYGKKHYNEMTKEEKSVIDEFQGEESYNKVMNNKDYYIVETSKLLMLA